MKRSGADKWFSYFIRLRDADDNGYAACITCRKVMHVKHMDCGHFVKRHHGSLRFNEKNCHTQCKKCNKFEQGNDIEFGRAIDRKYGQGTADLLRGLGLATEIKLGKVELKAIEQEYKRKTKEMLQRKEIEPWF